MRRRRDMLWHPIGSPVAVNRGVSKVEILKRQGIRDSTKNETTEYAPVPDHASLCRVLELTQKLPFHISVSTNSSPRRVTHFPGRNIRSQPLLLSLAPTSPKRPRWHERHVFWHGSSSRVAPPRRLCDLQPPWYQSWVLPVFQCAPGCILHLWDYFWLQCHRTIRLDSTGNKTPKRVTCLYACGGPGELHRPRRNAGDMGSSVGGNPDDIPYMDMSRGCVGESWRRVGDRWAQLRNPSCPPTGVLSPQSYLELPSCKITPKICMLEEPVP